MCQPTDQRDEAAFMRDQLSQILLLLLLASSLAGCALGGPAPASSSTPGVSCSGPQTICATPGLDATDTPPAESPGQPAPDRSGRLDAVKAALLPPLTALERASSQPNPTPTTRDLSNGALAALELGQPAAQAEHLLNLAMAQQ